MSDDQHSISIANGNLYINHSLYETYFPKIESVILLNKSPEFLIMPVQQAGAGGLLMKIKNSRGDRVISILEFLESNGIEILEERTIPVKWSSSDAALVFCIL